MSTESYMSGPFGTFLRGIIKLALAGLLIALVSSLPKPSDVVINNQTIPVSLTFTVIVAFFPIFLIISACRDLGVRL